MTFHDVIWFDRLPSTNTWLRQELESGAPILPGTVVAAREQTAGKGRKGRHWHCGKQDLAFSILLTPTVQAEDLPTLPMVVALAVRALLNTLDINALVKWPNDVVVDGKKICGILSECIPLANNHPSVIVGVGLNLGLDEEACREIDKPATSIALTTGHRPEREALLSALLDSLGHRLHQWEQHGFAAIRPQWRACAYKLGQPLRLDNDRDVIEGIFEDIGAHGELILNTQSGTRAILLGEFL